MPFAPPMPSASHPGTPVRGYAARLTLAAAAVLLLAAAPAQAQVAFSGQIRPRTDTRNAWSPSGERETFTSMRTRLAARAVTPGGITAFVQVQDVRLFGEETNPSGDFSADGWDVHQAWFLLANAGGGASLKIGRQEVAFGGERLISPSNWSQQARSFDGARLTLQREQEIRVDLLAAQIQEKASPRWNGNATLLAAYGTLKPAGPRQLDLYLIGQRAEAGAGDKEQWTVGARHVGKAAALDYRLEASWQTGRRAGADVAASLLGARVGAPVGKGTVTLWYDRISGTEPGSAEVGVFETIYPSGHKFYGSADLFGDIPAHTSGRGLQDLAMKTSWPLDGGDWTLHADVHRFLVTEGAGLAGSHLADELDLALLRRLPSGLALNAGVSYVWKGDALAPVRGIAESGVYGYLMLDVAF